MGLAFPPEKAEKVGNPIAEKMMGENAPESSVL